MRSKRLTLLLLVLLFLLVGGVSAREVLRDEKCNIAADQVIAGDLFVLCGTLVIDGRVEGNLIGAAQNVIINGEITGSIYLVAGQVDFAGVVGGSVHFAGFVLNTLSQAQFIDESGSLLSANLSNTIAPGVTIPGSVIDVGYQLIVNGNVGREVSYWGSALRIGGDVGSHVTATVGDSQSDGVSSRIETLLIPFSFVDVELIDPGLILTVESTVGGDLAYTGPTEGIIEGELMGDIYYRSTSQPIVIGTTVQENARSLSLYFSDVFREFTTLAFFGAIALFFLPRQMQAPLRPMLTRPLSTLGVGLLSFILSFPIVLIILLISVLLVIIISLLPLDAVALVFGVVSGLVNIGGASLFYFMAIFVARVIVGLALGRFLVRRFRYDDGSRRWTFIALALGLFILSMLSAIPVIGIGFQALSLFMGLGAILIVLQVQFSRFRETSSTPPPPPPVRYTTPQIQSLPAYNPETAKYIPPTTTAEPQESSQQRSSRLGTDNLPEGFNWWQD